MTETAPGSAVAEALLEVDGLRTQIRMRRATVSAVDGVSLTIRAGETVGLVGESGSGKSMTGLSIIGLLPPGGAIVEGSIRLQGRELTTLSHRALQRVRGSEIAMVFQDPMTSLNPTMTVGQQIVEPARIHRGLSRREAVERATEMLALVGMPKPKERLDAYPHQLSGGLRQRAMIAVALICEPKVLIADEPTTALDVTIQDQILSLLAELKSRLAMGLLLITHDLGVIAGHADTVQVMYAGRIVESADTPTLFRRMRHPYTQALFESVPDLHGDRNLALYSIPGAPPDLTRPPAGCRFAPRCRYVQDRCRAEDPPLVADAGGRSHACFFPVDGPRPIDGAERVRVGAVQSPAFAEAAASGTEPLLVLDGIVREFPITRGVFQRQVGSVKAVSDVSFEVARGETFGLVGESGCGKSTLAKLVTALDRPDGGRIMFQGEELSRLRGAALRSRRRDVQLMFQDPYSSLDPRMRVTSILREPLQAQRQGTRAEQQARIRELLESVGLPARAVNLYPHEFSGGQRQRIGFARALTLAPRLIVADEPVSALDVSIQSQILNLMKRLQAERELTYIVISHDLAVVRYLADRIGVMYLGKLVEIGPADEVYRRPVHPYTAGLLQAIPDLDPVRSRARATVGVRGELPSAANPPSGCRFRTRCPLAQEICAEVEPPIRAFSAGGHRAACHFPLQSPLPASPPGEPVAAA